MVYKGFDKGNVEVKIWEELEGLSDHKALQINIRLPTTRTIYEDTFLEVIDKPRMESNARRLL